MNSFLQGRKSITVPSLRGVTPTALPAAGSPPAAGAAPRAKPAAECATGGPTVEVVKEGDKVVRLIVTCSCGERTEIECLYPAAG